MKADSASAKVVIGLFIFSMVVAPFGVSYYVSDNVDDNYWFVLIAGPLTILGAGYSASLIHEYLVRTVAPNNKTMQWLAGYGLFFVFCLVVFFWYAEDFQEDYYTNIVKDSAMAAGGIFLLDCLDRFSKIIKTKKKHFTMRRS